MKFKNIKNSVIVLNSVWICKGADDEITKKRTEILNKITKKDVYDYIKNKITDKGEIFQNLDEFKNICKNYYLDCENISDDIFNKIKEEEMKVLKVKEVDETNWLGKPTGKKKLNIDYGFGLLGYINSSAKLIFKINSNIKKNIVFLFIKDMLKRELEKNKEDIEEMDELNKLKDEYLGILNDDFRKTIEEDDEIKSLINEIEKKINDSKIPKHKDKPKDKSKDGKTGKGDENKEENTKKNQELKNELDKLKKQIESLTSTEIQKKLDNIINIFKSINIDKNNNDSIKQINFKIASKRVEEETEKKKKEIEKIKGDEVKLKNKLREDLNKIKDESKDKKLQVIQEELDVVLNIDSFKVFFKEKEFEDLINKIKEIIKQKLIEELTKIKNEMNNKKSSVIKNELDVILQSEYCKDFLEDDQINFLIKEINDNINGKKDDDDDDDDDDDNNNKYKDSQPAPTSVDEKKGGCCGKNKNAAPTANKNGCSRKNKN